MRVELGTIRSSPFVGVLAVVTETIVLLPKSVEAKEKRRVNSLFDAEVVHTSLANSSLLGVLAVGNSRGFVVSSIVEQSEIDGLHESGLRISRVSGVTALGNLVECNDEKAFCSTTVPDSALKLIEATLKVECVKVRLAGSDLVGSNLVLTNRGFIANPLVSGKEFKRVEKESGLRGATATANYGDRFVGNSVIANSNAALVGVHTSGHELIRIDEGLRGGWRG